MFTKAYLMQMIPQQFADMQAKGFHNKHRSPAIVQGLIVSEIVEGFEALRKGRTSGEVAVGTLKAWLSDLPKGLAVDLTLYKEGYESWVKDTIEAEMAGTSLRCFDAIGARLHEGGGMIVDNGIGRTDGMDLETLAGHAANRIALCLDGAIRYYDEENVALFPDILVGCIPPAMGIQTAPTDYTAHGLAPYITELNSYCETLANMARIATYYGIDLLTHIDLEVAYNKTRPAPHGGKLF